MNTKAKNVLRCQHFKVGGAQCGSPALENRRFCFFHHANRPRLLRMDRNLRRDAPIITLPILEDANSIQEATRQVIELLLSGQIGQNAARVAFYGLQLASSNLPGARFDADLSAEIDGAESA
jgi:hypothetical protein